MSLKAEYYREVLENRPDVGWFEVHPENYMVEGGPPLRYLEEISRKYPLSLHGVGMSLGSPDPPPRDHLDRLRALVDRLDPFLVSEHVSWSRLGESFLADLLPVPMTREALELMSRNVSRAQDHLGRRILLENPSTYLRFRDEEIPEPAFLSELARRTGCGILLDVNNLYVCKENHGFDALAWLDALDPDPVAEIHLSGHSVDRNDLLDIRIDDHASPVIDSVWTLYREAIRRCGRVPTLIERDANLPPLAKLVAEAHTAERHAQEVDSESGQGRRPSSGPVRVRSPKGGSDLERSGVRAGIRDVQRAFRFAMSGQGDADVVSEMLPGPDREAALRLDVYRNNIASALLRALEGLYPALRTLMGAEFFDGLGGEYIRSHPPAHGRLVEYGAFFPDYVDSHDACADWRWFADVGRVELAWHRAYLAPEAETLPIQSLADVPPERMVDIRLTVHPSLQLLSSRWPASRIWSFAVEEDARGESPDLSDGPEWLAVVRPHAEVEVRTLGEAGFRFVETVGEGGTLGEAWTAAQETDPAFDLQAHLAALFAGETFTGFDLSSG